MEKERSYFTSSFKSVFIMAIKITEDCINCGACEPECPNGAVYENGAEWRFSDKTSVSGNYVSSSGASYGADDAQPPVSNDFYYIAAEKCTECVGFHDEPQCAAACPVDACVPDPEHVEPKETLLERKKLLHAA
jgi:ferredoxin